MEGHELMTTVEDAPATEEELAQVAEAQGAGYSGYTVDLLRRNRRTAVESAHERALAASVAGNPQLADAFTSLSQAIHP